MSWGVLDLPLLVPRVCAWVLLFGVALFDALKHRHVKRRGSQLHRGLVAVVFAYVVQELLLLSFAILYRQKAPKARAVCASWIFFIDLADTAMIAILLTIAAGFCITRDNLGPYKTKVLLLPTVYFLTSLVVDYAQYLVSWQSVCNLGTLEDTEAAPLYDLPGWVFFIANLASLAALMAFLLAVLFIFDTAQKERASLEDPKEGIVGAQTPSPDVEIGPYNHSTAAAHGQREAVGHAVHLPPDLQEHQAAGQHMQDTYAEVTGQDTDAPKTVEERLLTRTKLQLMRQFLFGVGAYVLLTACVIVLPLVLWSQPGAEYTAVSVIILLQKILLWAFLVVLCYIFRPREDSPYLLLEEEEGEGRGDTDTAIGEVRDVRTELGVLSSEDLDSPRDAARKRGNGGGSRGAGGNDSPASIDRNFTLGDLDDDVAPPRPPTRGRVPGSQIKARGGSAVHS